MKCGTERLTCSLCGVEGFLVCWGLACYAEDGRFERIERCMDHQACRDRLESSGEDWPLIDITEKWQPAGRWA